MKRPTPEQVGALVEVVLKEFSADEVVAVTERRFTVTPRPSRAEAEDLNRTVARPLAAAKRPWQMFPVEYQMQALTAAFSQMATLNPPAASEAGAQLSLEVPPLSVGIAVVPWISRLATARASQPHLQYLEAMQRLMMALNGYGLLKAPDPSEEPRYCFMDAKTERLHRQLEYRAPFDAVSFPVWIQSADTSSLLDLPKLIPLDAFSVGVILLTHQHQLKSIPSCTFSTSDRRVAANEESEGFANWRWDRGTLELVSSRVSQAQDSQLMTFFTRQIVG